MALAAPFVPQSDDEVLETLPATLGDARSRELNRMRAALRADPHNLQLAVALAQRYHAEVAAEGDPRYIGYAEAALAPWWDMADPPVAARIMRAVLLQFNHQFDPALADLKAAIKAQPLNPQAWSWLLAISLVQGHFDLARTACGRLQSLAPPLIAAACQAQIEGLSGRSAAAAEALQQALRDHPQADADQRLWVLTNLGEAAARHGDAATAEAAFRQALALNIGDGYLLAAYADFLLDQGRAAEVLSLLAGRERSDLLLLRLALAAKAAADPRLHGWRADLAARFDAARLRGDTVHQKEEARFALWIEGDAKRAVELAASDFKVQREPSDARMLLEAALAARQRQAAAPALQWLAATGNDDLRLNALAAQLRQLP